MTILALLISEVSFQDNEVSILQSYPVTWEKSGKRTQIFVPQEVPSFEHFDLHPDPDVPDWYTTAVGNAANYSWRTLVTDLGFQEPPDPDKIDIYITNITDMGQTRFPVSGNHIEIDIDVDLACDSTSLGALNYTVAHEFMHAVQAAYDFNEDDWLMEGLATWATDIVYEDINFYVDYVNYGWIDSETGQEVHGILYGPPDKSILSLSYDAVLFWIFLEEHYGGIQTIKDVLEKTSEPSLDGIYAVNTTLNQQQATTFSNVFVEWTTANYLLENYYSESKDYKLGPLFTIPLTYRGEDRLCPDRVVDWGADYFEIQSRVIYMPILFEGEQSHNLTKILIEHNLPLTTDFPINSSYVGFFPLMQANNLDKIVIIVRSLGNETSNNQVDYTLSLLDSSYTLEGPYKLTSSTSTMVIIETTASHFSSTLTLTTIKNISSRNSPTSTIVTVNGSSTEICSTKTITAVNKSSSQSSSETPFKVLPEPPKASFTYSPSNPFVNEVITFDASSSTPNGGNIISYKWNFSDGSVDEGIIVTYAYITTGTYTVTLNVTNSEGAWNTTASPITIFERVHDVALIEITPSKIEPAQGEMIYINVTAENQGGFTETFNVSLYYTRIADPLIGTKNVTLVSRNNSTLAFEWTPDTTGRYEILANTTEIINDIDPTDNTRTTIVYVGYSGSSTGSYDGLYMAGFIFAIFGSIMVLAFRKNRKMSLSDMPASILKQNLHMRNNKTNIWDVWTRQKPA